MTLIHKNNKWYHQRIRKEINQKREIGKCFRYNNENKSSKYKLPRKRASKRRMLKQNAKDEFNHLQSEIILTKKMSKQITKNNCISKRHQIVDHKQSKSQYEKKCISCQQNFAQMTLSIINCKICRKYLSKLPKQWILPRLCKQCVISLDICGCTKMSTLCRNISKGVICCRKDCNNKINMSEILLRKNIYKPTSWTLSDKIYSYQVDAACKPIKISPNIYPFTRACTINDKYYRIFCKYCSKNIPFCPVIGCDNKDYFDYCLNEKCTTCNKYLANQKMKTTYYHIYTPIQCKVCNKLYCSFYDDWSDTYFSNCGCSSMKNKICNGCYNKRENNKISHLIGCYLFDFDRNMFFEDVAKIIYQYSVGFGIQCVNYDKCGKFIHWNNSIPFHNNILREEYFLDPCGMNAKKFLSASDKKRLWRFYVVNEEVVQQNSDKYVGCINNVYIRAFCGNCCVVNEECKYCDNKDNVYKYKYRAVEYSVCMNHLDRLVKCDFCQTTVPMDLYEKCTFCNVGACGVCVGAGKHLYCKNRRFIQWCKKEKLNQQFNLFGFNEGLIDYYFISRNKYNNNKLINNQNNNIYKRASRKLVKNKRKKQSFWKRQHDKKGNAKYNKRSNRQKYFNLVVAKRLYV
eukprot:399793_1